MESGKNLFEEFINSLNIKEFPKRKRAIPIHDLDREYVELLIKFSGLEQKEELVKDISKAIKKAKEVSQYALPDLLADYVLAVLQDFSLQSNINPMMGIIHAFYFGYAIREQYEVRLPDEPPEAGETD